MRPTTPAEALPVDLSEARRVAVEAAEAAGALLAAGVGGPLGVRAKGTGGDVVTELDTAAEDLILGLLRAAYPRHRIIAEESGVLDGAPGEDMVWLVDPLDGTNNVAIGMPVYAVGLALCWRAEPVLGVVHDPVSGRTWSAVRGWGARGRPGSRSRCPPARARDVRRTRSWPGRKATRSGRTTGPPSPCAPPWSAGARGCCSCGRRWWGGRCWRAATSTGSSATCRRSWICPPGPCWPPRRAPSCARLDGSPYRLEIDRPASELGFVAARPDLLDRLLETAAEAGRHDGRPRVAGRPGLTG
ncbi:inositol monophosphatase family protein [Actinomadura madurae]|uniref:inositol monophosphatase family protein n=1 Tax=Actinomadura madurae TaxID=1993 RepID=UPI0020D25CE4|nr:inositol monophosphatase family protein [Actinomadura madurae]MCP9984284.1 inositol monophosphatase [Actinomadura madurae]